MESTDDNHYDYSHSCVPMVASAQRSLPIPTDAPTRSLSTRYRIIQNVKK